MRRRTCGQVVTGCCPEGTRETLSRRDLRVFVPKGLEGLCPGRTKTSQPRNLLPGVCPKKRPVPHGLRAWVANACYRFARTCNPGMDQTVPYCTDSRFNL